MLHTSPYSFSASPVMSRFPRFLSSLSALLSAERDLGGYCGQDPAVDAWICEAESALRYVLDEIDALVELPVRHEVDAHLLRVAKLFRLMLQSDDPAQVAYLRRLARGTGRFLLPWGNPLHFRVNQMILTALDQFETLLAIDDRTECADDLSCLAVQDGPHALSA